MFDFLFGWSKASKCKKMIKRARCRLKLLKNKRNAIVRQSRQDLAELIKKGFQQSAVNRVDQLIKDESLAAAYELLDNFCEFILTQLSYIRRHKDCPNDINEAASSLIYASARCGDLPELCVIRKLFGERYGLRFAASAVELFHGNLVNNQLKESLSEKSVPDDVKYRVVDEIARDYCLQPELLAIEYYPGWQQMQQVKEIKEYECDSDLDRDNLKLLEFTSSESPMREKTQVGYDCERGLYDEESESGKSSTRSYRKSKRVTDKRTRRRSTSLENQGIIDIGCMLYYKQPSKSPLKKHHKPYVEAFSQTCYPQKRLKMERDGCSLDHPCYFCVCDDDDRNFMEAFPVKPNKETSRAIQIQQKPIWNEESNKGKLELVSIPEKAVYNVFTYPDCNKTEKQKKETPEAYTRAMTMPLERQKCCRDKMVRTYSCLPQNPKHVHPKLPDYDDLAAKFSALKIELLGNK